MVAASEMYPSFNEYLQLVPMPPLFRMQLLVAMGVDFAGCLMIEWLCYSLLFDSRPKIRKQREAVL